MAESFYFDGFETPNGTYVPDSVFDEVAPQLKEAELRVLLYVIRRTFGFKKPSDAISLRQMTEGITTRAGKVLDRGTGLSKSANARGVHGLVEKGVIVTQRNRSVARGDEATTYALRFKAAPVSSSETPPCPPASIPRVLQETPQQTEEQNTEQQQQVVAHLMKRHIGQRKASQLAERYSPEYIQQKLELLEWKLQTADHPIKDATAWLIVAIEQDYQPPDAFTTRQQRAQAAAQRAEQLAASEQQEQERQQQQAATRQQRFDAALAHLRAHYQTEASEQYIWEQTRDHLQQQLDAQTYRLWLEPTHLLSLKDNTVLLGVRNAIVRKRVEQQLASCIVRGVQQFLDTTNPFTVRALVITDHAPHLPPAG